jgi:transposase-like protein
MYNSNEFVRRTFYSLELKDQICKDHIENGLSLRECVDKYNLSCHSLVHDWLRKLGYIAGLNRRTRSAYIGIENFQLLPDKPQKKNRPLTREQEQIEFLKKELEDARLQAEGYRRMIEIAESELKIPIRKKPNTR